MSAKLTNDFGVSISRSQARAALKKAGWTRAISGHWVTAEGQMYASPEIARGIHKAGAK